MLNARGWVGLVVDSHGPRGYLDYDVWRLICAGQLFMGSERAADVLISIYDARRMPFVDRDRMVLIGSSRGGWAVMELFAFEAASQLPFGLTAPPGDMAKGVLDGVVGAILIYPYCGPGNRSRRSGWSHPAPILFLLSGEDLIAPAEQCLSVAEILSRRGIPVEQIVFDRVTHGFDQVERAPFSALVFDATATAEALQAGSAFLERFTTSGAPGGTRYVGALTGWERMRESVPPLARPIGGRKATPQRAFNEHHSGTACNPIAEHAPTGGARSRSIGPSDYGATLRPALEVIALIAPENLECQEERAAGKRQNPQYREPGRLAIEAHRQQQKAEKQEQETPKLLDQKNWLSAFKGFHCDPHRIGLYLLGAAS